jgi:hypothetical protein
MTVSTDKAGLLDRPMGAQVQTLDPRDPGDATALPAGVPARRGRGRPLLMSRDAVLEKIRQLARRDEGIFRVHLTHGGLYARARRMFGSWAAAVEAAGVSYVESLEHARGRALRTRRSRAAKRRAAQQA